MGTWSDPKHPPNPPHPIRPSVLDASQTHAGTIDGGSGYVS